MKAVPFLVIFQRSNKSKYLKGYFNGAVRVIRGTDEAVYCTGKAGNLDICCLTDKGVKLFTYYTVKVIQETLIIDGSLYHLSMLIKRRFIQDGNVFGYRQLLHYINLLSGKDGKVVLNSQDICSKKRLESVSNSFPSTFI